MVASAPFAGVFFPCFLEPESLQHGTIPAAGALVTGLSCETRRPNKCTSIYWKEGTMAEKWPTAGGAIGNSIHSDGIHGPTDGACRILRHGKRPTWQDQSAHRQNS